MKNLITFLFVCMTIVGYSQNTKKINFGPKAGINVAYIPEVLEEIKENDPKIGFHAGFFLNYKLSDKFSVQPEIYYSQQGTKTLFYVQTDFGFGDIDFDLHGDFVIDYINIPVVFRYKVFKNFHLGAGYYVGIVTQKNVHVYTPSDATILTIDESGDIDEVAAKLDAAGYTFDLETNLLDHGFDLDAGYTFNFKNTNHSSIAINGRYQIGVTNLLEGKEKDSEATAKNSVFSLSLEYSF